MSITAVLFWFSLSGIVYAYLGYPLILKVWAFFAKRSQSDLVSGVLPKVTLIVSVFNEEQVIEEKIVNTLMLDYPRDLLEIVFVSDGSTDRTDEIISRHAGRGVLLRRYEGRIGKTACLNNAVPLASGEIIVFSDANSKYDREAIRALVWRFSEDRVGFVTGRTQSLSPEGNKKCESLGSYTSFESEIKRLESLVGSCVGADGAIFAIRKQLYHPLQRADINDLVIPLKIVAQGFMGKLEETAFCFEETVKAEMQEFHRQVRIMNRTIRALVNHGFLLNPIQYGSFAFQLFSHKVSRLLVPFFLLTLVATNLMLILEGPIYVLAGFTQASFYLMAMGGAGRCPGSIAWLMALSRTFTMVNLAILYAWLEYAKGETYVTWMPAQR